MKLTVSVIEEDIRNGVKGSPKHCPIANGLRRTNPKAFDVHVHLYTGSQSGTWWLASIQSYKGSVSFNLSTELSEKASHFDRTGEMEPFTVEVDVI